MTDIADSKTLVQQEAVDFRSSVSEAILSIVGGNQNFLFNRLSSRHTYNLNGPYGIVGPGPGVDGIYTFLFDVELTGFSFYAETIGSGTTTVDIHRLTGGGTDAGTIFSVLPSINASASAGSYTVYNQVTSSFLSNPTGHSAAALSTINLNAGDALRLDLDEAMVGGENFSLTIMFRPR